jgi:hypothetical protein
LPPPVCKRQAVRQGSLYPRQPFLPDFVKLHGGADVAQAVFGNAAFLQSFNLAIFDQFSQYLRK